MKQLSKLALAAAMVGSVWTASTVLAEPPMTADATVMTPGKGLSLDIGSKHAIGYFETANDACNLTLVLAESAGGEAGTDSPGTRIVTAVLPGTALRIDAAKDMTAEFLCGPAGKKMNARVFERAPYGGARS